MSIDRDSNQSSLEGVMHTAVGVVMVVSLAVMVAWPQVQTVVI